MSGIGGFITKDSPSQAGSVEGTESGRWAKIYFIVPNDQSRNFIIPKNCKSVVKTAILARPLKSRVLCLRPFKACVKIHVIFVHLDTSPAFPCQPVTIFTQGCDAKPCGKSSFHGHLKRVLRGLPGWITPPKMDIPGT